MFGHQDDQQDNAAIPQQSIDGVLSSDQMSAAASVPATTTDQSWQHPGTPLDGGGSSQPAANSTDQTVAAAVPDAQDSTTIPVEPAHDDYDAADSHPTNDLIDIKQRALTELSPLVGHLEQSPEEKFRTTMMMIQASDDSSLIKAAYEAADAIEDEKTRAQALLDVVNEINYFTQNGQ